MLCFLFAFFFLKQHSNDSKGYVSPSLLYEQIHKADIIDRHLGYYALDSDDRIPFEEPMPVVNQKAILQKNLVFTSTKRKEHFQNIIENAILEYKECAGKEKAYVDKNSKIFKYNYLKTYVSVGIPIYVYNRLLEDACTKVDSTIRPAYNRQKDGYIFLTADMNGPIPCNIYSNQLNSIVSIGSLSEKMMVLKSNVIGFGCFKVDLVEYDSGHPPFIKFTLTDFQLVDTTNITGAFKTSIEVGISQVLRKRLNLAV